MLVFVEVQVSLGLLVLRPKHTVGRGELGHDQAASPEIANEAAKDRVRNARHGSQDCRGSNLKIADHHPIRHTCGSDDGRPYIRRIVPVLAHPSILLPSPSYAAVSQFINLLR